MILGDSLVVMNSLLHYEGLGGQVQMNIRPPAKSLTLSAEAEIPASATGRATLAETVMEAAEKGARLLSLSEKNAAIVFGPENGAVSEKLVYHAAREAHARSIYGHLFVIGFAIQPNARNWWRTVRAWWVSWRRTSR